MDSGWIDCDDITSLIGINEAGKSNLISALWKLNPARNEGESRIDMLDDLPRHKHTEWESTPEKITFVYARFMLDSTLRAKVVGEFKCEESAIEIVEIESLCEVTIRRQVALIPELAVITGYQSVNDVRFSVEEVDYLNVNLDGNSSLRISTHNESTIRLYLRGGDEQSYEFLSDSRTLNVTASDIPVYLFIPDSHFEPVFRDLYVHSNRGPVAIFGGSIGNTFLAESIDISTNGHSSDIHIEDIMVSLFISVHTRNSDIILRNVVGDRNRLNVSSDRGNIYVLD
jgi:hypothetical protein